jgi:hypothetical protein
MHRMRADPLEDIPKTAEGIDAQILTGVGEAVQDRCGPTPAIRAEEQLVLSFMKSFS